MPISRVRLLDPLVAERIAAGEVIERPASVVKELVENSLDAGATEVCVLLEDGGKTLIEVMDNGHGMGPEDLQICIERHATSKIRSLEDLEKLATLGFRGEALPSVAAVSELSLLSRSKDDSVAYELTAKGPGSAPSRVTFGHFLNSPHGTRIQARGLFSQIPARLKFLKSQASEVSQVREWIERLALTHPEAGFRLVSDDRTILNLRPQDEVSRIRSILSDGDDYPVVTESSEDSRIPGFKARVHWLQGLSSPQTRKLIQVVNGRAVRDRVLQQALLASFRQSLLPGQFPAVVLFLELDPSVVDVNVHPTKTELRFLESGKVFHAVEKLVDQMIHKNGAPAIAPASFDSGNSPLAAWQVPSQAAGYFGGSGTWHNSRSSLASVLPTTASFEWKASEPSQQLDGGNEEAPPMQGASANPFQFATYVGTLFNTYLCYDLGEEMGLIDQHAAHERVRYEILRKRIFSETRSLTPQQLLIPEAVRFPVEQRPVAEAQLAALAPLGFEAELFGEDTYLFRAVPAEWGTHSLRTRLKNLVDRLLTQVPHEAENLNSERNRGGSAASTLEDASLFEALASEACHSAIRAGDRLERVEASALVEELFSCEHPWNCPHGRPTVVRIPRAKLEEWFQRRV